MPDERILVVHDDPQERAVLAHALRQAGYAVVEADAVTGAQLLEREPFALLAGTSALYREARAQSLTDLRTGLPNVRYLQEHLPVMLAQAARSRRPLSLVFIDSDSLKQVNDRFGHDAGDRFVKEVADTIKGRSRGRGQGVRSSDVVVRYTSGDEFVVVMPDTTTRQAAVVAERLRTAVSRLPFVFGGEPMHCTISLGVATYPKDANSADELIRRADDAMYAAKRLGKDRVVTAAAAQPVGAPTSVLVG